VILKRLLLENFGPYFGTHDVDLAVGAGSGVILVYGENMRGKTSIVNAIRWCLYGTTKDRYDKPIPAHRFMSYDALDGGDFHMAVELTFDHDGKTYELERRVQAIARPTTDRDLKPTVNLKIDGHLVPGGDIAEIVSNILHPEIARFFLFDGEMLAQYEVLLGQPSRASDTVRSSIEQILGLPALTTGLDDIASLKSDAQRRQTRALDLTKRNDELTAKTKQAEAGIDAITTDLDALGVAYNNVRQESDALAEKLQTFGDVEADIKDLDSLEQEIAELRAQSEVARLECKALLVDAWWLPVANRVKVHLQELDDTIENEFQLRTSRSRLKGELDQITASLPKQMCELCGQAFSADTAGRLVERQRSVEAEISHLRTPNPDFDSLMAERRNLRAFGDGSLMVHLAESERRSRKALIDQHKRETKADEIRKRLRDHDRAEIKATQLQLERAVRQLADLEKDTALKRAEKVDLEQQLARLQQEIGRLPGGDRRTAIEVALYGAVERLLQESVGVYRDRLRSEVEAEATAIFKQLTTEPAYARLEINQQYGLRILDSDDRVIVDRSAGAEQIVALALIGALSRCATKEGPVVMDTPFGRLDLGHRERILRFLPSLNTQVVLLVQSGELERRDALRFLGASVAHEYQIVRDQSPTRSRFEKVTGD
jgi:DNA sulfur modification protein DndD